MHPHPKKTSEYMKSIQVHDIFGPDRRVAEFGEKHGFAVLSLASHLQAIARERQIYLHGFDNSKNIGSGHWNQNGHRAVADLISAYLCNK